MRKFILVLLIFYHGLIFFLSSLSGDEVGGFLTVPDYAAHFLEYTGLSFLWFLFLKGKKHYSIIFSLIYGLSDEIHQLYVPGRTFAYTDLLADGLGAVSGVMLGNLVLFLSSRFSGSDDNSQADNYQD